MADQDQSSKTEEPTAKKLREAHERGQFAKAPEVGVVFVLAASFAVLLFGAKDKAFMLASQTVNLFSNLFSIELTQDSFPYLFDEIIKSGFVLLTPVFVATVGAAIIAGGIQSGFRFTPKVIEMDANKLNPVKGLQNIFSMQSLVTFGIDGLKFVAIGLIIYSALNQIITNPIFFTPVNVSYLGSFILEIFLLMFIRLVGALAIIAALSFFYQRYKTHKNLMMTKQEVKDEMRQAEGDPHVKMSRRRMAMQLMQRQMLDAIPTADVVVTNPTHFAVALKYEREKDAAPMVIAKGKNLFAQRIKQIAAQHDVPIQENKPVARLLYKVGRVGRPIPYELYQVIAQILAHVYKTHRYYFHRLKARRLEASKQ